LVKPSKWRGQTVCALNNWNNSAASSFDDSWNNAYVNTITQAQITTAKALAEGSPRLAGAAK
jgi:hypothetical protein